MTLDRAFGIELVSHIMFSCIVFTFALRVVLGVATQGRSAVKGASRAYRPDLNSLIFAAGGQHSAIFVPCQRRKPVIVKSQEMKRETLRVGNDRPKSSQPMKYTDKCKNKRQKNYMSHNHHGILGT